MEKKLLGILIMMLMISAVALPTTATINQETYKQTQIIFSINNQDTTDFLTEYGKQRIPVETNYINIIPKSDTIAAGPNYEFLKEPETVFTSFYDYFPGSYCGFPLAKQTDNGDGLYLTFHARETSSGNRRQYYAYVDSSFTIQSDIIYLNGWQGYGGIVVHPATGNAIASWHEDEDGDGVTDIAICYDDFDASETPGAWEDAEYYLNTESGEYIWPYVYIGPSPDGEDYVRVYIVHNNAANNDAALPCEDVHLFYTDIQNTNGIDMEDILDFDNWDSVIIFDDWRDKSIRPFQAFAVDYTTPGKVAFCGNAAWLEGDVGGMLVDEGVFVWESLDYGETWSYSNLHTDGPDPNLYMVDNVINADFDGTVPDQLSVGMAGTHSTAIYDGEGNLHYSFLADYGHETEEGRFYLPYYMPQMEFVFDGSNFEFHEVSKMPGIDPSSGHTVPWTDAENAEAVIAWSTYPSGSAAIFHENSQKQAVNLQKGWMAQIWTDGTYAKLAADGEGYTEYLKHPIVRIAISTDNGATWSDPIQLTDVNNDIFDFTEQITVYPYICNEIEDLGDEYGRIDISYFDDNVWGSSVQGTFNSDKSGQITYCSIKVDFSTGKPPTNPTCTYDEKNDELTATSTDPDGDQIRYGVSWNNDQNVDKWTTFANSGDSVKIDCEGNNGTVGVIAEDSTGKQSGWISITPKNKSTSYNPLLSDLFQIIYQILQKILKL